MKKTVLLSIMSVLFVMSCGIREKDKSREVLAVINGEKITLGDVETKYPDLEKQLTKMDENIFRYKEMYLNDMVDNKLIEVEAKKLNKQPADLLAQEVTSKIKPITDEDIAAFAKERGITKDQLSKFKDRIKMYLGGQKEADVRKAYAAELKKKYNVVMKMKKPKGKKINVQISDDDASKGPKNAKVTVVEFSDFQCPFCKKASDNGARIMKDYGDKVRFVFRHFPLSFHENAHKAAQAAACANEQGKFFEMHDKLFENNTALTDADFKKYATELALDAKKFEDCLTTGKFKSKIDKDLTDGQKYGISGAPTYFINGYMVVGAVPYDELKKSIDEAMVD
ncbi:MAG: thioredoxin domain-containing protein [Pseudomonadota bacterium]